MKDSDYIIIDTTELKALFAPKERGDEWQHGEQWCRANPNQTLFSINETYRRLRSRAWLPINGKTYPRDDTPMWLLHKDGSRRWVERWRIAMQDNFTHWQPAPAAPGPPSDTDGEAFEKWADSPRIHSGVKPVCKLAWEAGRNHERSKPK